jgi:putative ABC transport system permease protein
MQAQLVARYPNVSVIDLREVLDTIQSIVNGVTLGVSVVGGLVLLAGLLILVGAVSMTKFQRVYEAAILKTLGASSRLIAAMLLLEYGVLGAIAGTIGALGAIALSWAVATYALELDTWHTWPSITLVGIVATALREPRRPASHAARLTARGVAARVRQPRGTPGRWLPAGWVNI